MTRPVGEGTTIGAAAPNTNQVNRFRLGGGGLFAGAVLATARDNSERFTEEFLQALPSNLHVFDAFEREALRVVKKGFRHYSARTIIEVLRHNSALAETGGPWKLNDWHTPYWARLFVLLHPEQGGLFEFRETKAVQRERELA